MGYNRFKNKQKIKFLFAWLLVSQYSGYTGCVIIIDAFLVRSPARTVIGNQTVDGCRRDPRQPSHMVGGE